jgi:hypothetical protein
MRAHLQRISRRLDPRPRQPFFIMPRHRTIFVRVPKAASTSIMGWFEDIGDTPEEFQNLPLPIQANRRYTTISFVRNPYSRIASAWTDKILRGGHSLGGLGDGQPDFAEFVDRLSNVNISKADPHVRPQATLLGKIRLDFVGHSESLQSDLDRLASILSVESPEVPHANSTGSLRREAEFSDRTIETISRIYADDFLAFGYSNSAVPAD